MSLSMRFWCWSAGLVLTLSHASASSSIETMVAQEISRPPTNEPHFSPFLLGVQGAAVLSNAAYTPEITTDPVFNPGFGLVGEYELSRVFSLELDLNYLSKGALYSQLNQDYRDAYHLLEVPLLLKFKPLTISIVRIGLEFGPSFSVRLGDNQTQEDLIEGGKTEGSISNPKTFSFGVQGGVGIEVWVKRSVAVFVSGRYSMDLTEASKVSNNDTPGQTKLSAWEFFLGPKIRI